jgi:hypothetical protein
MLPNIFDDEDKKLFYELYKVNNKGFDLIRLIIRNDSYRPGKPKL